MTHGHASRKAVIAQRVADYASPDTEEIKQLARSAGYEIVGEVTQSREEDPEFNIGSGKVDDIFRLCVENNVDTVIFDNRLGPYQTYNIGLRMPETEEVIDRFRLILEIFAQRADTRKAQLQVELAELRYELPRAEAKASLARRDEHPGFMGLGEYDETREESIKGRISNIRDELKKIEHTEQHRRDQRREAGFDLVALAGYTNAGKSTLMQRLADELAVGQNDTLHEDLDPTAEAHNQLFTTLGTTTRRLDLKKREVLVTDTVGFISDLPHWLVESFKSTLDSVYRADLVLLVADVSEPVPEIREKLITCHDVLRQRNEGRVVTVFNKADRLRDEELQRKLDQLSDVAYQPVVVSAAEGDNIEKLEQRIGSELPSLHEERFNMPLNDGAMRLLSWLHDNAHVTETEFTAERVTVEFEAKRKIIGQGRAKLQEVIDEAEPHSVEG